MELVIAAGTAGFSYYQQKKAGEVARRSASKIQKLADGEKIRVRREEAEADGLVAAAKNQRSRPTFLSKAGFSGLRSRLGGNRQAVA